MSIWTFISNHLDLNIHATIKKITLRIMLGSIPHKKFCFYHLPTRGRAGIKLGDAWYVSNVSIIFDCSMLLYYPSRTFYMHLYDILYDFVGISFLWLCYFHKTWIIVSMVEVLLFLCQYELLSWIFWILTFMPQ